VGKNCAHACFSERPDGLIGMIGAVHDVRPVNHGGDTAVERLQRAQQIGGVNIFRPVGGRNSGPDSLKVLSQGPVGCDAAQDSLPGVTMGINKAGQNDHFGGIDDLGIFHGQIGSHSGDNVILDENVRCIKITQFFIHSDDNAVANKRSFLDHRSSIY
jgi:hypothetical protein